MLAPMLAARRLAPSFRSFVLGLILAAAWGSVLFLVLFLVTGMGHGLGFGGKLRWAVEIGGVVSGVLFLLYQAPLNRPFFALCSKVPRSGAVFFPLWIAYHLGAFPGLLIGRVAGLLRFAGKGAGGVDAPATATRRRGDACPFEGRVIAEEETAFRDTEWTRGETIFEVKADWRVVTEKVRYWGVIDEKGDIREASDEKGKVVASIRLAGEAPGAYVGTFRLGGFKK
jgi:hypothetical protein